MDELVQITTEVDDNQAGQQSGKKGLFIRTFGCQMNEYDSQKLARILNSNYELAETPEQAEVILINTCSVREKPEINFTACLVNMSVLKRKILNSWLALEDVSLSKRGIIL